MPLDAAHNAAFRKQPSYSHPRGLLRIAVAELLVERASALFNLAKVPLLDVPKAADLFRQPRELHRQSQVFLVETHQRGLD